MRLLPAGAWCLSIVGKNEEPSKRRPVSLEHGKQHESAIMRNSTALLSQNPIRAGGQRGLSRQTYENVMTDALRHGLDRRSLLDTSKRKRDFELFLRRSSASALY